MIPHRYGVVLTAAVLVTTVLSIGLSGSARADSSGPYARFSNDLAPRRLATKMPAEHLAVPERSLGRLVLKVKDEYRAKASPLGTVVPQTDLSCGDINAVLARYNLTVTQAINHPIEMLESLERDIENYSRKDQPYFPGYMYVNGDEAALAAAALELNEMDSVEVVVFDSEPITVYSKDALIRAEGGFAELMPSTASRGARAAASREAAQQRLIDEPPSLEELLDGIGEFEEAGGDPACCFGTSCFEIPAEACTLAGGVPHNDNCPASGLCGACCLPSGEEPCQEAFIESICMLAGGTYGGDASGCGPLTCPTGACCLVNETCFPDLTEAQCDALAGGWLFNQNCDDAECEIDCGEDAAGDCYDVTGNVTPFCDDMDCCELICTLDPFCCEEDGVWDVYCAAQANILCSIPVQFGGDGDRCASFLNGSCFEPFPVHDYNWTATQWGCQNETCCNIVVAVDPFCTFGWDIVCANLARAMCSPPPPTTATPDYELYQGYLSSGSWDGSIFADIEPYLPEVGALGLGQYLWAYTGEGYALRIDGEPFDDVNGNGWRDPDESFDDYGWDGLPLTYDYGEDNGVWDEPSGLRGLGDQLLNQDPPVDCTGQGNLTEGETIKVAVIDFAFWPDHEDLDVTIERGQSLLLIEEITFPDHGTGLLSIINAIDNRDPGVSGGVTGIVPDADAYFYPLTSIEEGAREISAWVSAIAELGPGDVICTAYEKLIPTYNPNNDPVIAPLIAAATDRGISVVIAAGDRCTELSSAALDQGTDGRVRRRRFVAGRALVPAAPEQLRAQPDARREQQRAHPGVGRQRGERGLRPARAAARPEPLLHATLLSLGHPPRRGPGRRHRGRAPGHGKAVLRDPVHADPDGHRARRLDHRRPRRPAATALRRRVQHGRRHRNHLRLRHRAQRQRERNRLGRPVDDGPRHRPDRGGRGADHRRCGRLHERADARGRRHRSG